MQAKSPKIALYTEKQINAPRDMRGVSPVCVYRAWTPSLADRRMPFRFFYVYWLGVGHKRKPYGNVPIDRFGEPSGKPNDFHRSEQSEKEYPE